jgi:Ni/Co efflux regulator RcnB
MSKLLTTLLAAAFAASTVTPVAFAAEQKDEKKTEKKTTEKKTTEKTTTEKKKKAEEKK